MATVGHGFIGLALGAVPANRDQKDQLRYLWPGLIVLFAFLPDLVEWIGSLAVPNLSPHFLEGGIWKPLLLTVIVCTVTGLAARLKRPLPYLVIAAAVLSHFLMDLRSVRTVIADAYGKYSVDQGLPGLFDSVVAEIWLYGFIFVEAVVLRAAFEHRASRQGRTLSLVVALIVLGAALTRNAFVWVPSYFLALAHAGLLLRRHFSPKFAWSLAPLLPLLALATVELTAFYIDGQARSAQRANNYHRAIQLHRQVLRIPKRGGAMTTYANLFRCYVALGDWEEAEAALKTAEALPEDAYEPFFLLARFYIDPRHEGTTYFRPREAEERFRRVMNGPYTDEARNAAASSLQEMKDRGLISAP